MEIARPRRSYHIALPVGVFDLQRRAMLTENFLKGRRRRELTVEEREALESVLSAPVTLPKRRTISARGDVVTKSTFLISGFMCRYMDAADGQRQLVSVETPGDFVDLHGYPLQRLDHDIATISECQVAYAPHEKQTALVERYPHLGRLLWLSTLLDASITDWTARRQPSSRRSRTFCSICGPIAAMAPRIDAAAFKSANFPQPMPASIAAPNAVVSAKAGRSASTSSMSARSCASQSLATIPPSIRSVFQSAPSAANAVLRSCAWCAIASSAARTMCARVAGNDRPEMLPRASASHHGAPSPDSAGTR